jgi:deaminated glutathione amidase
MLRCELLPIGYCLLVLISLQLRFPEPSLRLAQSDPPATLITYPSAFTIPTGKAHWSPLLRARAIETQCYVVAAAQVGKHNEKRESYGRSMVIGPWGDVLVELDRDWIGEPQLGICEVSDEVVQAVRQQIPSKRRWDVYGRC